MKGSTALLTSKMENPSHTCIKPRNLRMTVAACFYCGNPEESYMCIEWMFGLKHCKNHKEAAVRDCKAYMHENKLVTFRYADEHPILGPFLKMMEQEFPVLRSNGEFQPGWTLNRGFMTCDTLLFVDGGEWILHVALNGDVIKKGVSIASLKRPEVASYFPEGFQELVDQVLFCLVDGIFYKEYQEVQYLPGPDIVPEVPLVGMMMYQGEMVRYILPPPEGAAVVAHVQGDDPSGVA